jgi:protein O-GlcNAc transferase
MSSGLETGMIKARNAEKRGDFSEAERVYQSILQKYPRNARARHGLDKLVLARSSAMLRADAPPQATLDHLADLYRRGLLGQLVAGAGAALAQYPRSAFVHNLLGSAYLGLHQPDKAEAALRAALEAGANHPAICNNLGMALAELGRHGEAADVYGQAIALNPRYATAYNNLGNSLKQLGRLLEALEAYEAAIAIEPEYVDAHSNFALALRESGRLDEAERAYRRALGLKVDHAVASNNFGNLLADRGNLVGAIELYEAALRADPNYSEAYLNLGNVYKRQGRTAQARDAYARAQAARPDYADAWIEQAKALALDDRLDEAVAALDRALAIEPGNRAARAHSLFYRAYVCDWSAFADFADFEDCFEDGISPFGALTFQDDPEKQLQRSRAWVRKAAWPQAERPTPLPRADKIRIGYFSADFQDHATMYLLAGLLREHDRGRFEIHAFSFGAPADDAMRRELLVSVDAFHDIADMPDAAVVALARGSIDIAVDLKGFTQGSRAQLFAQRLAPLQVGFLGYPGSMGGDFIDYLVADPVVIPGAERGFYDEKLLLLPDCYQANDDRRQIAKAATTRADFGLPVEGFVFCSFNQSYKITPREFDIWMRLLNETEGSVLWLLESNRWAAENLRSEAAARGIAPDRLVFAGKLPQAEHLARLRHADLFLDSFAVNAHTTASDALWAGLPLVTLAGRQFAARVGASLLTAIGLPELIATSEAQYEALCRELAGDRGRLAQVKAVLADNCRTRPLFDTAGYTRKVEAAFAAAWNHQLAGEALPDITL